MNVKNITYVIFVILLAVVTYSFLTVPDQNPTAQESRSDAVDALSMGVDKAIQQLEEKQGKAAQLPIE